MLKREFGRKKFNYWSPIKAFVKDNYEKDKEFFNKDDTDWSCDVKITNVLGEKFAVYVRVPRTGVTDAAAQGFCDFCLHSGGIVAPTDYKSSVIKELEDMPPQVRGYSLRAGEEKFIRACIMARAQDCLREDFGEYDLFTLACE
jgi:hypothetical protein